MARRGRPRKFGPREANGQIQRPSTIEKRRKDAEAREYVRAVVLAQPHRRGAGGNERESAIGRFIRDRGLDAGLYLAACDYRQADTRWRKMAGLPVLAPTWRGGVRMGDDEPTSAEIWDAEQIVQVMNDTMAAISPHGLRIVRMIVLEEKDIDPQSVDADTAIRCLTALAISLGYKKGEIVFCGYGELCE